MSNGNYAVRRFVAAALGLGAAAPLFAQTSQVASAEAEMPKQGVELTEVIVTARRVEERLQDVPISITVFNQDQLTNRNVVNAADLANYTPSLSANTNFGSENSSFAIRGFVQDPGTPPSVGVYFADVVALRGPTQGTVAGDGAGPGSFFDLQNVQVLKGPQGTLFGRNTTGGAVLFVPQKPTSSFEGYIEGSAGNYAERRVEAMVNLPASESIRFRLALDHNQRGGYLHNISGIGPGDYNDVDYTAVRASLVVDVTSNIENYTIASYSHSDTNGSVQKLIACNQTGYNPPDPRQLGNFIGIFSCGQLAAEQQRGAGFYDVEAAVTNPDSFIEQWQVVNTTTWTATDAFKIKNIASYGQYQDFQRSPLFGTNWQLSNLPVPYPSVFFRGIPAIFTGIFPIPGGNSADQATYTEELQLQGSAWDNRLTYQGGVYFEWSDPLALVGNQSQQLAACDNLANLSCTDPIGSVFTAGTGFTFPVHIGAVNYTAGETFFRDRGVYLQSTYSLTDRLKLTGGARGTWDEQTNTSTRITNNFSVLPPYPAGATPTCTDPSTAPTCSEHLRQKSSKPTWLLDLDYKVTDDVMVYGKYARGYRAGGVFANAPIDHRTFAPESVNSYEAGIKSSFMQPVHGLFNLSAFYNDFSNQQIQFGFNPRVLDPVTGATAPVSPTTAIINAGKSRIYGAEAELSVTPLDGLNFDLNYTYLNATIRRVNGFTTVDPNYQAATSFIAPGSPLALSPKNKASLTGSYTLPLPASIGRVIFGATFTHTDKQLTNYIYGQTGLAAAMGGNFGFVPSTDLLNLNLNWNAIAGSPVDVSFFATNVTGKQYYSYIPGLGGGPGFGGAGVETAVLGEPRMYGMRIKYHFGK